ncbi:MAG TPA: hypothetical protein QGF58_18540 [Myxococcota bacterium]|nr:hypothetical protein [Myxococcota bacterium]
MLLLFACSEITPIESDEDFTNRLRDEVASRLTGHTVELSAELQLSVTAPDGFEQELHLDSVRADCLKSPDGCKQAVIAYVDRQGRMAEARSEPLRFALLRPMLFNGGVARALELEHRPFVEDLVVVLVLDSDDRTRIVDTTELASRDSDFDTALSYAMAQLGTEPRRAADRMLVAELWTDECVRPLSPDLLLLDGEPEPALEAPKLSEHRFCWRGSSWIRL